MAGIAGKAGNLKGQKIAGGNVFEGPRSREFPLPPPPDSEVNALFRKAAAELGYHPFFAARRRTCRRRTRTPTGSPAAPAPTAGSASASAARSARRPTRSSTVFPVAKKTGKLKLIFHANAFSVRNDGKNAQSVLYYDGMGHVQEQPGDVIVLGAYVMNNVRLLLMSKLGKPYDPVSETRRRRQELRVPDRRRRRERLVRRPRVQPLHGLGRERGLDRRPERRQLRPRAARLHRRRLGLVRPERRPADPEPVDAAGDAGVRHASGSRRSSKYYKSVVSVGFQGESPAYRQNYLDLDPNYRDIFGNPLLRMTFDWQPNERKMVAWAGSGRSRSCGR